MPYLSHEYAVPVGDVSDAIQHQDEAPGALTQHALRVLQPVLRLRARCPLPPLSVLRLRARCPLPPLSRLRPRFPPPQFNRATVDVKGSAVDVKGTTVYVKCPAVDVKGSLSHSATGGFGSPPEYLRTPKKFDLAASVHSRSTRTASPRYATPPRKSATPTPFF
eukprot:1194364-Prorocentrum_minimum.AAC.9